MWTTLVALFSRLAFAWARRRLDDEARAELDMHLDLLADRYMRSGMTPDEARIAARRQLGNLTMVREEIHRTNGVRWIDRLTQDARYALRQLRRGPGFAAVVVATLALGIGGTTAVFSVVQAVLLAPLPFEQPGQLVRFYAQEPGKPDTQYVLTGPHFTLLRDEAASLEDAAALSNYAETGVDLVKDGRPQRLRVLPVTSDYFRTLRAGPLRGRGFERDDDVGTRRVVLSDALWRARFGGDPSVIGTTIQLNARPYEVAGIAPQGFEDPIAGAMDAWVPYGLAEDTSVQNYSLTVVGRLRSGVTLEQAAAEMESLSAAMKERWPDARRSTFVVLPLQEDLVATSRAPLQLLLIAVGLVLLVACVNVANLVLVRATGRVQEFAVRSALGSGRRRLAHQLVVESVLLATCGGLLGVALASIIVDALKSLGRDAVPRINEVVLDPVVLGFAALVTLATAIGAGVAPALRLARVNPSQALHQHSRSNTGTRAQGWLRSGLAAAQLALALTLLMGAAVLLASFHGLQQLDLGFRVDRALTFGVNLPSARYDAAERAAFQEELARRIETIPGVRATGGISFLPATGSYNPWGTRIESGPLTGESLNQARGYFVQQRAVSGNLFAALEIPLLAGRVFDARDDASAPARAVVSASFARQAFPGMSLDQAIGQRIRVLGQPREIIGVVGDVALDPFGAPTLAVYHAHRQFAADRNWALTQVAAVEGAPQQILSSVRAEVAAMDPDLVVHRPTPLAEVVGRGIGRERFALVLMGAFAGVALLLATLGLYGVLAYNVRQRTQEIGIRMALGATAAQVRALVLRQAAIVLSSGIVVGVIGALMLGRWLSSLVVNVSPSDPGLLVATTLLLLVTGLVSAWLPARRASRVAPRLAMQEGH